MLYQCILRIQIKFLKGFSTCALANIAWRGGGSPCTFETIVTHIRISDFINYLVRVAESIFWLKQPGAAKCACPKDISYQVEIIVPSPDIDSNQVFSCSRMRGCKPVAGNGDVAGGPEVAVAAYAFSDVPLDQIHHVVRSVAHADGHACGRAGAGVGAVGNIVGSCDPS